MKKMYIILLVFTFTLFFSSIYAKTNVSIESVEAKSGEKVDVKVNIKDNTGIVGAEILVKYDKSKLEYISGKQGNVLSGKMAVINDNGTYVKLVCVGDTIKENGELMTLTFKVKNDVTDDKIPLNIEVEKMINDLGNEKIVDVENTVQNGYITISNNEKDNKDEQTNIKDNESKVENNSDKVYLTKNDDGSYNIKGTNNLTNAKYSTSDESIATVDKEGNITPKGEGTVVITSLSEDGKKEEITVKIPKDLSGVEIENREVVDEKNDKEIDIYSDSNLITEEKNDIKKNVVIIIAIILVIAIIGIVVITKRKKK